MAENQLLDGYIDIYMTAIKYIEDLVSAPTRLYDLSFEQFLIMRAIKDDTATNLVDIASQRQVTRGAISRQIRVLLKRDYITQEIDPNDRRRLMLKLTPSGHNVLMALIPKVENRFNSWIDVFGQKNAEDMLALMQEFRYKVMQKKAST